MAEHRQRVRVSTNESGTAEYKWVNAKGADALNDRIVKTYIESGRINEFLSVIPTEASSPTFREYVADWLETYKKPTLKPTTYKGYKSYLSAHLLKVFGDKPLSSITTKDIQEFLNERVNLSRKTLKLMLDFLGMIFKDAKEDHYMQTIPTESRKLKIPSNKIKERNALSKDEIKDIENHLFELKDEDRKMFALMMFGGLRRGEALGVKWNDIQWEDGYIHITRNVTFAKNQPCIGTPKTQKGYRLIPLNDTLIKYLGEKRTDDAFIIGEEQAISHQSFKWRMKRIQNTIDLHGATPHVLRHTYLTYLAATGLDVKTLQAIAGHSDIRTTMNRYVHPQKENIMRAGALVDKMLD